jgi:hypothetical protein
MGAWITVQCDECGVRHELPAREIANLFNSDGRDFAVRIRARVDCAGWHYGEKIMCNECLKNDEETE